METGESHLAVPLFFFYIFLYFLRDSTSKPVWG